MDASLPSVNSFPPGALLAACLVLLLSVWLRSRYRGAPPGPPGPPGPFAWPVIGNAAQLGDAPHLYCTRMARKYGDVFRMRLGSRTVVVLNGAAIRPALTRQGLDFAGRPDFTSFRFISDGQSLAFGTVSDSWKTHRKLAQSTVRMFSSGNPQTRRTFERHVLAEFGQLLRRFVERTRAERHFRPGADLVVSTANVMSAVCFGTRYGYEDAEFREVVGRNDRFTRTVGAGSIVDVMPWLQWFPNPIKTMFEDFKKLNRDFGVFVRDKVAQHRKSIGSSAVRDMTDAFIVAVDRIAETAGLSRGKDYVSPTMGDIFGASQDTLSTALQWIVLILVKYPEVQTRLQLEVDRVVGRRRLPSLEDQAALPYVMSFLYEVMRFTSFVPLTIPHCAVADTSILGFAVPKDTVVFINQWSVNHDPDAWSGPGAFRPERFLDQQGALDKDLAANVLIFSLGRRRCIGEQLSKAQLFLFTALLAHQCRVAADPAEPPTLGCRYGLTLKPHDFAVAVALRDDMALLDAQADGQAAELRAEG